MLIGYEDIKLVLGAFSFAAASSEKNRPENLFFMSTTKRIVLAVISFCSQFPDVPEKFRRGWKANLKVIAKFCTLRYV